MSNMTWDEYFIGVARAVAMKSKDSSSKIGCIAVGLDNEIRSTGYNDLPRFIKHTLNREERPLKYKVTCHAEENTIIQASRVGVSLKGCRLYVTVLTPCSTCSRMLIQAGIVEVIVETFDLPERWKEDCEVGLMLLKEANIKIRKINEKDPSQQ